MARIARRGTLGVGIFLLVALAAATLPSGCSYIELPGGIVVNFPGFSGKPMADADIGQRVRVPEGFSIRVWASGIESARILRFTAAGDLLVSSPGEGKVFLLEGDTTGAGHSGGTRVLLDGLNLPHGLWIDGDTLWVAETDAVARVPFDVKARRVTGPLDRVVRGLPTGGNHYTRTIAIGPDRRLYVALGSSCNVCMEEDARRAGVLSYALDGSDERIFAAGLRNPVGIAFRPGADELWATDNGRDLLGDDFPPCELNRVVAGGHYGWPFANGARVPDPDFGADNAAAVARSLPPVHSFGAHTAPLGLTFGDQLAFPEPWRGAIFVALHGSWNRRAKQGYQVVALLPSGKDKFREEPFVTGFESDNEVVGRPVDVAPGPDGALYVSDDFTGQIYRVAWGEGGRTVLDPGRPGAGSGAAASAGGSGVSAPADPFAGASVKERQQARVTGARLWAESGCAACHQPAAPGAPYRPLVLLRAKWDVTRLTKWLAAPKPPMPRYAFDDAQRRALALWLLESF